MDKRILGVVLVAVLVSIGCIGIYLGGREKKYEIKFDSKGGSEISSQIINEGEKISKPSNPIKEGYKFIAWEYDGEIFDFDTKIEKNITLIAKWEKIEVTPDEVIVTFDSLGGTSIEPQKVKKDSKIVEPKVPEKAGYKFIEWQLNSKKYDFGQNVTENITLVAKYEEIKKYTVSFNTDGGSNVASQTVEEGKKATQPATPTKNGYIFSGWILNGTNYNFNSAVTSNITLKATWTKKQEIKKYTVSFNTDGGSNVASQTVEEGKKATQPATPTKDGYTFSGWTLNGTTYDFNGVVTGNITLKATWTENVKTKYTVSFNTDGGSNIASQTVEEGKKATLPATPTKDGYTFSGWTLNGTTYDFNGVVTGDITLKAIWKQHVYTITETPVDQFSPDRVLTVYENGNVITVIEIMYSDGVFLCSGSNPTVSSGDIAGETNFKVKLTNGVIVNATKN